MNAPVVVIGGGLAGLTAAIRLTAAGCKTLVLESHKHVGGRATSFLDVRSGLVLDNCQHVLMGCCTSLLDLYRTLGVETSIEWFDALHWMRPDGGVDVIETGRLPAPLHQAGGFARMRMLAFRQKVRLARTLLKILRMGRPGRDVWRGRTFTAFLDASGESQQVRDLFWTPVVVSSCNAHLHDVAATHALQVFQDAFLASRRSGRMGVPKIPLIDLYQPAHALLKAAGSELRCGCPVRSIDVQDGSVSGVTTDAGHIEAQAVICATPWDKAAALLPEHDARRHGLDALGHSPILGVHLLVDREVMHRPHLILPGREVQWLFNKGMHDGRQHLHAVISAADDWMDRPEQTLKDAVLDELHAILPALRAAESIECRPVKTRQATFRATPGAEAVRPDAAPGASDIQGLYLAGDWCRTGWPATMEGAVRSGHLAAKALLGPGAAGPPAPLATSRLPRLLGLKT